MKNIVIIGAGDFGKEIVWLIEEINKANPTYVIIGFLDDDEKKVGKMMNGYQCVGTTKALPELIRTQNVCAVIAMQDSDSRKRIAEMIPWFDNWETLIHPSANIADTSELGKGCVVCAGSNISVNTILGKHCILNLTVTMGHDCEVGDFVSIMSGAVVSGHVVLGERSYLGSNSTILPSMKVGKHAKVGAGSVVIRNVKDEVTVMGVPAKILRV